MARRQLTTAAFLALVIACLTIFRADAARAGEYPDPTVSLDSLVYRSDFVVEARLVQPKKGQPAKGASVRITAVYRGSAKAGETIFVNGISDFEKPSGFPNRDIPLGPKDHLVLFLKKEAVDAYVRVTEDALSFELGARLELRGNVYDFSYSHPFQASGIRLHAPSVALVPSLSLWLQTTPSPVPQFRERLRASAGRALDWHAHLDVSPTARDIPWLISLLKQRHVDLPACDPYLGWYVWALDQVAHDAAKQVAKLQDFSAIDQAIQANPQMLCEFSQVCAAPRGRDYLLTRVSDRAVTIRHRQALILLMSQGGGDYYADWNRPSATRPGSREEKLLPRNASYLTRIARVAVDASTAGEDDVAADLLTFLKNNRNRDPQIELDLQDAADVLREFYARKNVPESVRFDIENTMYAIGAKQYETLHSSCGTMLTLAAPGDLNQFAGRGVLNSITVRYEYCRTRDGEAVTTALLVVDPVAGGNSYVLNGTMCPQRDAVLGVSRYGQESVPLPQNLKPGRYRVHYRLLNGSSVVSEGHGFETMLPQQAPATTPVALFPWPQILPTPVPWPRSRKVGILVAVIAVPASLVLRAFFRSRRQYRRARKGLCPRCAYDLRFSRERCPECGTPVSANIARGIVRKCLARMILTASAILLVATSIAWVRSYHVAADCWIRTTGERADSVYFSRGAIVLNLLTTIGQPGLSREWGDPQALPRSTAESGDLPRWNVLGIEYSAVSDMLIVPMWSLAGLSAICGAMMVRTIRRVRLPLRV